MMRLKNIIFAFPERFRRILTPWWGGIGCRVSFFMSAALMLVAVLVGAFFSGRGKKLLTRKFGAGHFM